MRWIYLAVIILFAAATIVFALQNFEIVTMTFLGFNARVPLALLVAVAYLLGAVTGGSLDSALLTKRNTHLDQLVLGLRVRHDGLQIVCAESKRGWPS